MITSRSASKLPELAISGTFSRPCDAAAVEPRSRPLHSRSGMRKPPIQARILPVTPYQQNCSLVWCTTTLRGAVIDPGGEVDRLKSAIAEAGVTLDKVLLTHG